MDFATRAKAARFMRADGKIMTWPQFRRWSMTRLPVRETRDLLRRRRLGGRP